MNKVAAFALRRKNSILSMSEKVFCPPQPLRFWITPACAGKSHSFRLGCILLPDHPRVCGEKFALRNMMNVNQGSPPRMRGKDLNLWALVTSTRITPAYAGKRSSLVLWTGKVGDHPRVCGEKGSNRTLEDRTWGSPPRMRGKAHIGAAVFVARRITPAYAGKRLSLFGKTYPEQDHPRVCGEKQLHSAGFLPLLGSPPRMRGKDVPRSE